MLYGSFSRPQLCSGRVALITAGAASEQVGRLARAARATLAKTDEQHVRFNERARVSQNQQTRVASGSIMNELGSLQCRSFVRSWRARKRRKLKRQEAARSAQMLNQSQARAACCLARRLC